MKYSDCQWTEGPRFHFRKVQGHFSSYHAQNGSVAHGGEKRKEQE